MVVYDIHQDLIEVLCKWVEAGGGSESSKQLWLDVKQADLEDTEIKKQ